MNSDAFNLTPHDVRSQEFHKGFRGYEPLQVDEFKERMAAELERLLRERSQHEERIRNLQEQLRAYREREKALNDALVSAQQMRVETREHAERDAESLLRDARSQAEALLRDAKSQADMMLREAQTQSESLVEKARLDEKGIRDRTESAARQYASYLSSFRAVVERHLAELDGLQRAGSTAAAPDVQLKLGA